MSTLMEMRPAETPDVIDDARHASQPGINVIIDIRRVINLLLCIVTTLVITGTIANVIIYQVAPSPEHKLARLMHRFDLGFEPSLPNWYSSFALLASSGLLAIIGLAKWRAADRFFKHWLALAVIFLGLSIDEGVRMHEMIHTAVVHFVDVHGILYLQTIVPTLLIVVIIGLCYLPFLKHLERRTSMLFVCAGAIYVLGAVGIDVVGGMFIEQQGIASLGHTISQSVEESFEMLGIVLFLYALLDYIRRLIGPIRFEVSQSAVPHPAGTTNRGAR